MIRISDFYFLLQSCHGECLNFTGEATWGGEFKLSPLSCFPDSICFAEIDVRPETKKYSYSNRLPNLCSDHFKQISSFLVMNPCLFFMAFYSKSKSKVETSTAQAAIWIKSVLHYEIVTYI